jgi:hypothetical protein
MTQIFIIATLEDAACAAEVRGGLEAQGYAVWQEPPGLDPESISYPKAVEAGLRGSAAVILIWSASAAASAWVERETLYGQQLQKPILLLTRDDTPLPITVVNVPTYDATTSCSQASKQLRAHLPPPDLNDVLLALLTHQYIRERKKGIAQAAELLQRGERPAEMLAVLEDIARYDLIESVRQEAQAVLDKTKQSAAPATSASDARHMVGGRCSKGHITYFDKRAICASDGTIPRAHVQRADKDLDEVYVTCATAGCGEQLVIRVDCEGYR